MNLLQNIDLYCERLSPGLWAEPANALSNLAFFAAALWLWRRAEIRAARALQVLVALIALIGVCSGAFHLAGQIWAEILDVGSITLFILCFVVFFLREVFGLRWWLAALGAPGFILFGRLVVLPFAPGSFNGSVDYFPALFGLALMTLVLLQRRDRAAAMFAAAAGTFLLSLSLRSEDLAWCEAIPLGTHWLWHCLNAVTLTLATLGLAQVAWRRIKLSGP